MQLRKLGQSDVQISSIIMGLWQAGKEMWVGIDDKETTQAIRAAFEAGITTFDTAEAYGKGHSERILASATSDIRNKLVYATKVFANHLKYDQVLESCDRSLKNLQTDYIDLYQIHWPSGSCGTKQVPIEETMRAMNELKEQGKIREIGLSNFSRNQIEEASRYGDIQSLQPPYSILWRHAEKNEIPYCAENGVSILAYSSMAQGILTGKFKEGHRFEKGDHRSKNRLLGQGYFERVQKALDKLHPIAGRNNISLGQLALCWVITHPNTCAIAGVRNREQVLQNSKAADMMLPVDDMDEIDEISSSVTDLLDDNPVMWE